MARRGSSVTELSKKRKKLLKIDSQAAIGRTKNSNQTKTVETKKSTKVKGRKLSPYEMKKAERIQAMKDKAKARHKAWKESRKKK